jgi:hypothetical protein
LVRRPHHLIQKLIPPHRKLDPGWLHIPEQLADPEGLGEQSCQHLGVRQSRVDGRPFGGGLDYAQPDDQGVDGRGGDAEVGGGDGQRVVAVGADEGEEHADVELANLLMMIDVKG